jgi:hypothetical protein
MLADTHVYKALQVVSSYARFSVNPPVFFNRVATTGCNHGL